VLIFVIEIGEKSSHNGGF